MLYVGSPARPDSLPGLAPVLHRVGVVSFRWPPRQGHSETSLLLAPTFEAVSPALHTQEILSVLQDWELLLYIGVERCLNPFKYNLPDRMRVEGSSVLVAPCGRQHYLLRSQSWLACGKS